MPDGVPTIHTPCPSCGRSTLTIVLGELECTGKRCKQPKVRIALEALKLDAMKWNTYTMEKTRIELVNDLVAAREEISRLKNQNT